QWRDNLLRAIEEGAWMAGAYRKPWGPIHPTPSAWLIREARTSFRGRPNVGDKDHPRFRELVDLEELKSRALRDGCWHSARLKGDTADGAWFHAAVHDRAALVSAPDFRHFWLGSFHGHLSRQRLVAEFPELAAWFARSEAGPEPRHPDTCAFRRDVLP